MGIKSPLVCDDIDMYASELLREEDPEPMELIAAAMLGGGGQSNNDDEPVYR
jgi:hypothetical protein